jgi:hypothetical protein
MKMNIEAYKERFRRRLDTMTAEELKNIFEEVLELKKDNIEISILKKFSDNKAQDISSKNLMYQKFIVAKKACVTDNIISQIEPFSKVDKHLDFKSNIYKKATQYITRLAS